jgi:predicted dehydrogenase
MSIRIVFVGFRHGHIFDMLSGVQENSDFTLVGACEEDPATRQELSAGNKVAITHDNFDAMLAGTACDAVAIGDYYSKRGSLAIRALRAGKHVIADKPLCTDIKELDEIEALSKQKNLAVGCQMDFRVAGPCFTALKLLRSGVIGEIHTVTFTGQHPLLWGTRPAWYFQKGYQGGTINDIFVHAADAIELLTGLQIVEIVAARAWNAGLPEAPLFQNAAQLMLRMDNNAGVIGDVSYLAADKCGYKMDNYWRFTMHGRGGLVEFTYNSQAVMVTTHADSQPRYVPVEPGPRRQYLADFLNQIKGLSTPNALDNAKVLRAARVALLAQHAADTSTVHLPC